MYLPLELTRVACRVDHVVGGYSIERSEDGDCGDDVVSHSDRCSLEAKAGVSNSEIFVEEEV